MSTIADLLIKVRADTGAASKDISSFGSKVSKGFGKALLPATAALGVMGVVGKMAFDNLQDGAKNAKQTEQVIKTTGGAANVTATHVDALSNSLRRKAGVDDDVVHAGANMLLTFTNVRNEVGKGNAIFDQATTMALDMGQALGTDAKNAALQLGKALNDPIKGVGALSRVGVSFTAEQKEQIKTLVESGNTMGAQKIILAELGKEFGGAATNIDPMQRSMANLKLDTLDMATAMITGLMPAFQAVIGLLGKATSFMEEHKTAAKVVMGVLAGLALGVIAVNAAMKLYVAGAAVVKAATAAWTAVQWLLNAAMTANPIGIVILALVALGAAIVIAWNKSETFRNIVLGAWAAIKAATMAVFNFVRDHISGAMSFITAVLSKHPMVILVKHLIDSRERIGEILNGIKDVFASAFGAVKGTIDGVVGAVQGAISIIDRLASAIRNIPTPKLPGAGLLGKIPGFAGGVHNFGGGLAVVGENGPELVNLPGGSSVFSNSASRGMVGAGTTLGGGDDSGDVVLLLDGEVLARFNRRELNRKGRRNVGLSFGTASA